MSSSIFFATAIVWCLYCYHINAYISVNKQISNLPNRIARVTGFELPSSSSGLDGTFAQTDVTESNSDEVKKTRRVRYSGSYPKAFKDKYKEIRGDAETVSKVLAKGSTPAGTHVPIMLEEVLEHLGLNQTEGSARHNENCLSIDCTLGFGGHSKEIVRKLLPFKKWKHVGIDQDAIEIRKTQERILSSLSTTVPENVMELVKSRISFHNQNFGDLESLATTLNFMGRIDVLMADLGYSSMQIDDPSRGFTFKAQGPLDMRMDPTKGESALEYLNRISRNDLKKVLEENSDEVMALQIATCLKEAPIPATTTELSERVRNAVKAAELKRGGTAPATDFLDSAVARTMQAIRIEVNGEFRVLEKLLEALPRVMAPGGRVVFLTFHSGLCNLE
jgi:16S rRNA (cytosine1402-N4)-methyltransferase